MRVAVAGLMTLALGACDPIHKILPEGGAARVTLGDVAGRWRLASPVQACTIALGAGVTEGTVAPEGGCPGDLSLGRKWGFRIEEPSAAGWLVIRDETGKILGQFTQTSRAWFEGRAAGRMELTLTR